MKRPCWMEHQDHCYASYAEVNESRGVARIVGIDGRTMRERKYFGKYAARNAREQARQWQESLLLKDVIDVQY